MRAWLAIAVLVLVGGCMGPAVPAPATLGLPEDARLRLLTVDDEQVPIPGAVLYWANNPRPYLSDQTGEIIIENVQAGTVTVRAWAPAYYRAQSKIVVSTNATEFVILERRPADKVFSSPEPVDGDCQLAWHSSQGRQPCSSLTMTGVHQAYHDIALPDYDECQNGATRRLEYVAVSFQWRAGLAPYDPALDIQLVPKGDLSGQTTWLGRGPHVFRYNASELPREALDGDHAIRLVPSAAPRGEHVVLEAAWEAMVDRGYRCIAPPNFPW